MKGRISPKLEAVLNDPRGREQLKTYLIQGKNGRVMAGDKYYSLRVDVRNSKNARVVDRSSTSTGRKAR